jgi:hypothetical protein
VLDRWTTASEHVNADRVDQALRNNLHWYEVLCRAHGVPGEQHPAYWINHGTVPPYMSSLVTLADERQATVQLGAIRGLIARNPRRSFSVKDAFHCLDLKPLGFSELFSAQWIHRAPSAPPSRDASECLTWSIVQTAAELAEWERTWRGTAENRDARGHVPIFVPALLAEVGLHFLLGTRNGASVATAALNRSGDVLGLSNVFSDVTGVEPLFPGCVRLAHELYPDLPLVGYERDAAALAAAERSEFERVGQLTVWIRT